MHWGTHWNQGRRTLAWYVLEPERPGIQSPVCCSPLKPVHPRALLWTPQHALALGPLRLLFREHSCTHSASFSSAPVPPYLREFLWPYYLKQLPSTSLSMDNICLKTSFAAWQDHWQPQSLCGIPWKRPDEESSGTHETKDTGSVSFRRDALCSLWFMVSLHFLERQVRRVIWQADSFGLALQCFNVQKSILKCRAHNSM